MEAVITIYHDKRREKKGGTYPVKIKVYDGNERKYYPTGVDLTEADFLKVMKGDRLTKELKKVKDKLDEKKAAATRIASKMEVFDIAVFDRKYKRPTAGNADVFSYYQQKIEECRKTDGIKNAKMYEHSRNSLLKYSFPKVKITKGTDVDKLIRDEKYRLDFKEVVLKFLQGYQKWMTDKGHSLTTVSMYMRNLRTIFNAAIHEKDVSPELYPFGNKSGKYMIPAGANVKQAIEDEDLKKLWEYETTDELINRARDFWFFIYNAYGMNVRDIVLLKNINLRAGKIDYVRKKTKGRTKKETHIEVPINAHMQKVIDKYGTKGVFVFDVLKPGMNEEARVKASDAFVTFINDHMERLAKLCGVTASCTSYAARHTFGTKAIRNGAPMELIQELLGHQHLSTTQNYFKGFEDPAKRAVSDGLMNFQ